MHTRHWMLWDGDCRLCKRVAAWVRWKDKQGRFQTIPYQQAPSPPMTPALYAACEKAVHVLKADGTILRGGRATLFIMSQLGFRFVAWLLLLPPFIWFVEGAYRVLAGHRDFFAGFLFTKDHSSEAPELPIPTSDIPT